jgi:transposase
VWWQPGVRVKTNRRDAMELAKLSRVGELTAVWVSDELHEARSRARSRGSAEAPQGEASAGLFIDASAWASLSGQEDLGPGPHELADAAKLERPEQRVAFGELFDGMRQAAERVKRLEQAIRGAVSGVSCEALFDPFRRLEFTVPEFGHMTFSILRLLIVSAL